MNLPEVFQNKKLNLDMDNQQILYYSQQKTPPPLRQGVPKNIDTKLRNLFASTNYVYKLHVKIITKTEEITTTIIGKNNNYLITYDNQLIPLKDITDIYEI